MYAFKVAFAWILVSGVSFYLFQYTGVLFSSHPTGQIFQRLCILYGDIILEQIFFNKKKERHCPDLNRGSPVYQTGALTAKPQRHITDIYISFIYIYIYMYICIYIYTPCRTDIAITTLYYALLYISTSYMLYHMFRYLCKIHGTHI